MGISKVEILEEIKNHSEVFKKASQIEYRIRCPICGDSRSNPRDSHCYIKCSYDPTEPLLYHCFKCNSSGRVNKWFLEKIGLNKNTLSMIDDQKYNRIQTIKSANIDILTGSPDMNSVQVKYIENRLDCKFSYDDYDRFKIIWNMDEIYPFISNQRIRNTIPSNINSISFLSDDKSMLLNRSFLYNDESQWRKIKLIPFDNKSFYTIKSTLNLFTTENIIVNIAEGIFDILSVYKNFNDGDNSVYIAALGSDYISALNHMINKGFIGNNIIIKIYIDNGINEKQLIFTLKQYKWLFKSIYIYKNIANKDVGVPISKINLSETRI